MSELGSVFHYVQAKSELKNFRWDPGQMGGGQSSFNLMLISEMFCIDIFHGVSYNIKCITAISNLHLQ